MLLFLTLPVFAQSIDIDAINAVYPLNRVEAGTHTIGCTPGQGEDCDIKDAQAHDVILTRAYLVGETEVTQALYQEVMGSNPSEFASCGPSCPVERVSWFDTVTFANKLSERLGLPRCYEINGEEVTMPDGVHCGGLRLPTEAEWEVAARGGQDVRFSGSDRLRDVGWCGEGSPGTTHPVGQRNPNGYGLYDMSGNVWERVWDSAEKYPSDPVEDPAVSSSRNRIFRGGSWNSVCNDAIVADRNSSDAGYRLNVVGFRLVLSVPPSG